MPRLLIIDDDPDALEMMTGLFEAQGYQCEGLDSAEGLVEKARSTRPDLVLLDLMLPGMSGFEACRQLRTDPELFRVPIMLLSAMHSEQEIAHGLSQGADDYVGKPFDSRNLVQRVGQLVESYKEGLAEDALTGLASGDHVKREVQRRLGQHRPFALISVELNGLREYARKAGGDARGELIRKLAQVIQAQSPDEDERTLVGHMGGGYFIVVTRASRAQAFCDGICSEWEKDIACGPAPIVCATLAGKASSASQEQLFDTLAQLRRKALERGKPGLYADRRTGKDR